MTLALLLDCRCEECVDLAETGGRLYTPSNRFRMWYQDGSGLDGSAPTIGKSQGMKTLRGNRGAIQPVQKKVVSDLVYRPHFSNLHPRPKIGSGA